MKKIAFYISGERESIVRSSAVINTMLCLETDIEIHVVVHYCHEDYIKEFIKEDHRIHYRAKETDIPFQYSQCLQKKDDRYYEEYEWIEEPFVRIEWVSSRDWEYIGKKADRFLEQWDGLAEKEKEFLKTERIELVVSDLCPWIFIAADELRIKSILLTDFTWDHLYDEHMDDEVCELYRENYEMASKVVLYDVHMPEMETIAEHFELVSLISHPYDMEMIWQLKSNAAGPIVFVGEDMPFTEKLEELPFYFIYADEENTYSEAENVLSPDDYVKNMHNYIAASDYVIARPHWDIMAYSLLANKKAAYCPRIDLATEWNRTAVLKEREQCIEITEKDLTDLGDIIKRLDSLEYSYETGYHNDDYEIAKLILESYPKKKRNKNNIKK